MRALPNPAVKLLLARGEYEGFERHAAQKYVRPDSPVVELGGCLGVVACITNRALEKGTSQIVVEANPLVIALIEENRTLNHCKFRDSECCHRLWGSSVIFCPSFDSPSNSLREKSGTAPVTVSTVRLEDILRERKIKSFTLICDIEGHEYDLVRTKQRY